MRKNYMSEAKHEMFNVGNSQVGTSALVRNDKFEKKKQMRTEK